MSHRFEAKLTRYRLLVELMAALVRTGRTEDVMAELHSRIGTLFVTPITLLALRLEDGSWRCLTLEGQNTFHKTLHTQQDGLLERAIQGELTYTNNLFRYSQEHRLTLRSLDPDFSLPYSYSWMGVPLTLKGELAGVLSIQSYSEEAFTDDDLEFLRLLSTHLGIAIENALLREQLERDALTDALTGLGNRRAFVHSSELALSGNQPLTLAVMDVQSFKKINDDLGHPAGDAVLAQIGALLRSHAQPEGQVFRLGGDEFGWLLPLTLPDAKARLRRFLKAAEEKVWPVPMPVRLNVGLAEHHAGTSLETLMRDADTRMYDAKLLGVQLDPA